MGPWNPWLHEARIGKPIWDLTKALSAQSNLPDPARQVAILVTGAHFRAAYEVYAHVAVAEHDKLPDAKLATIVAGQRPPDLTRDEAIAYDVAARYWRWCAAGADLSRRGRCVRCAWCGRTLLSRRSILFGFRHLEWI